MPKDRQTDEAQKEPGAKKRASKPADSKQVKKLNKHIEELENKVGQLTEDVRRERADFMNYKRRAEMEQSQIMQTAKAEVITQLLPIFDDLERALSTPPEAIAEEPWVKGISQVYKQVQNKLNELGAERIECVGHEFNPELHEAVGFEDGQGSREVVIEELRPGYKLNETVLRPSMVKVGKAEHPGPSHEDSSGEVTVSEEEE